ncbi:MAG: MG2 domain-containing protein, partial [Candidatus Kapaibacterium sp.]
ANNNIKVKKQNKNTQNLSKVANISSNKKKLEEPTITEILPPPPREAEDYPVVKEWNYTLKATKDSWRNESIPVPLNEKGVYIIEAYSKGYIKRTVLIISENVAVLKQHGKDVMVFVVNQQSGEKVSDFPLTFLNEKIEIGNGKTNSSGVLKMNLKSYDSISKDSYYVYDTRVVLGFKDDNFVICDQMTYNYENDSKSNGLIFLQTERPVYRPSHTVYYRGVVRNKDDYGQYIKPKKGDSVFIEINDSKDAIVKKDTLITNDLGSFNSNFVLTDEASTGTYSIKANCNQLDGWQNFTVDEYKKPEYKVEVIPEKKKYTKGDTVIANVKANYFFGSPVATAKVTYFIYRSSIQQPWWVGSDWEYLYSGNDDSYSDYRSTLITSNSGSLNPDGTFKIVFPTQVNSEMGFTYRIKASVEDASRRSIEASTSVTVTFSEFFISSRTDKYFYGKSDFIKANLTAKMYDENKPLSTSITATLKKISWKKLIQSDKTLPVKYERVDTKLWEGKVTTNDKGLAEVNIPPTNEKGYFIAEFNSKDKNGSVVYSNEYIYIGEQDYSKDEVENNYGSIKIIPDKPAYNKGETISALIIGPAPKVDALISIEGQTLYSYSVERFNDNSSIVHFEAEEKLLPEFTLSVSIVVNGTMYTGEKELKIIPDEKLIKLEIKTDKVKYLPSENANISIRTLNSKGEPCPNVEVALGLVDEAIYSIEPDITPNIQRYFFGPRYNQVSTSHSYNFNFSDAFKNVSPTPGYFGFADNGNFNRKLYLGDVKGNLLVQPAIRKDFRDMAYWKPDLRTDNNGLAKIIIKMPDNLTKWRISARAIDANSAVGQQFS